ncbi:MAG: hypothetical protein F6J94_29695, partial [Moorea sp. SIO1F2]|nr:hypothetical protein [Moorena sp. SIO1F2]
SDYLLSVAFCMEAFPYTSLSLPVPCSLFPVPCSLFPSILVSHLILKRYIFAD